MTDETVNPHVEDIRKTFAELTDQELETVLENSAGCFAIWRHTTFVERAAVIAKAAAVMRAGIAWTAQPGAAIISP